MATSAKVPQEPRFDRNDLLVLAGAALLTAGAAWIYRPMLLILPGLLLTAFGYVTAPKKRPRGPVVL